MATFHEHGAKNIFVRAAEPLSFDGMNKEEALTELRDAMATMVWEMIEAHSTQLKRNEMRGRDYRLEYMEERKREYLRVSWTKDVWEDELVFKHDRNHPIPSKMREYVDFVATNSKNAAILAPVLLEREEDKKYDFKQYMHNNWNK